jgi:hypothetical protein
LPLVTPLVIRRRRHRALDLRDHRTLDRREHAQAREHAARAKLVRAADRGANVLIAGAAANLAQGSIDVRLPAPPRSLARGAA